MNYLAHFWLAGEHPDWRLGGLLGDFVKGPLRGDYPLAIEQGIRLHRRIDAVSAELAPLRQSLDRLGPPWRRHGGIVLDIFCDHVLARHWSRFHPDPLNAFSRAVYGQLRARRRQLPGPAARFAQRAEQVGLLESYAQWDNVALALARTAKRLRRPVPLAEVIPQLAGDYAAFEAEALAALTELAEVAAQQRARFQAEVAQR